MMERPIGIDLFAGVGGMSLGFEQAGFDVAAAVEIDPIHAAAHAYNFPRTAVLVRSAEDVSAADIRAAAGIGDRPVDCVFGGAPCQGFSLIGKRNLDDPRNRLALAFLRLVCELDARTFVFENVKGMTVGRHKAVLDELIAAFQDAGYDVVLPWRVLNAAHHDTPQSRERLILMGARKGEPLPSYPAPTTNIAGRPVAFPDLPMGPSCEDALGDLPDAEGFEALVSCDSVATDRFGPPSAYARSMRPTPEGPWWYGHPRVWDSGVLTSSARTDHGAASRARFRAAKPGTVEPVSRFFKLPGDGVANTLRAGTDAARGAFTSPRPIHHRHDRCITVREMARLHGFPDWFRCNATKWHGARQIGNAVPPPLARAIAAEVVTALGYTPTRPQQALELGEERLVGMAMAQAAAHFGSAPIKGGRDRKAVGT